MFVVLINGELFALKHGSPAHRVRINGAQYAVLSTPNIGFPSHCRVSREPLEEVDKGPRNRPSGAQHSQKKQRGPSDERGDSRQQR